MNPAEAYSGVLGIVNRTNLDGLILGSGCDK